MAKIKVSDKHHLAWLRSRRKLLVEELSQLAVARLVVETAHGRLEVLAPRSKLARSIGAQLGERAQCFLTPLFSTRAIHPVVYTQSAGSQALHFFTPLGDPLLTAVLIGKKLEWRKLRAPSQKGK